MNAQAEIPNGNPSGVMSRQGSSGVEVKIKFDGHQHIDCIYDKSNWDIKGSSWEQEENSRHNEIQQKDLRMLSKGINKYTQQ